MSQVFALQPWEPIAENLTITGSIQRHGNQLQTHYQLQGELDALVMPIPQVPQRRFALWEATCFEFFLAPPQEEQYWEFNLSPSGDWNVFHLDGYRQGLRDETAWQTLPFTVTPQTTQLDLHLTLDLSGIMESGQPLIAAITTVLQHRSGAMSYWALSHPGPEADFHRRDSFIIELPGTS